jgi:hypothetical protein
MKLSRLASHVKRIIHVTDEHRIVRAGGDLIGVLENRYHTDSPRWWWPRGLNIYRRIRTHCKRARKLEKSMRTKEVTDRWQELARRGSRRISVTVKSRRPCICKIPPVYWESRSEKRRKR